MIELWCKLIINKVPNHTFNDIKDESLKREVAKRLSELGYDTNGDPFSQEVL